MFPRRDADRPRDDSDRPRLVHYSPVGSSSRHAELPDVLWEVACVRLTIPCPECIMGIHPVSAEAWWAGGNNSADPPIRRSMLPRSDPPLQDYRGGKSNIVSVGVVARLLMWDVAM